MKKLEQGYRWAQLLSIDVVLGAIGSSVMAAVLLQVTLPWAWWVVFPLSVWVVYTADHLMDAIRLGDRATSDRHRFHVRWLGQIFTVWVTAVLLCGGIVLWAMPVEVILLGIGVGGLTLLHFGLVWLVRNRTKPWLAKETGVALVYTGGVWGGPVALFGVSGLSWNWLPVIQFFLLALINLMTFALYEELADAHDGFSSWVRGLGRTTSLHILKGLVGLVVLCGVVYLFRQQWATMAMWLEATLLAMLVMLVWVAGNPERFSVHERYRAVADGAFLLPLIWVPVYFGEFL